MDISVVIPVYGCPGAISELYRRLVETLEGMKVSFEIIMVDDRDGMGSWDEIKKVALKDSRVKAISFTYNCGQDKAISAGVAQATGDWIIPMDCDLQDAPEKIPQLYEHAVSGGYDIVFVRRHQRKDSKMTQFLSKTFHKVFSYFAEIPFDYELGTYLIASKRAADKYRASKDRGRDFTMYLMWLGYKHDFIDLEHENRFEGKTSYTFKKKMDYAIKMMTTFSNRILYVPIHMGIFSVIVSIIYLIFVLVSYFSGVTNPEGWNTLIIFVLFFGGAILSTLGIIGLYIGNIFDMTKQRPLYVVQETINCEDTTDQ
ncbi:MAG: glycosyltransferase family 2 protein [Lachnospiraceae bacterium]|nr:glycosyltransferase family 2 protein [Lachnospiraceae bacterium]